MYLLIMWNWGGFASAICRAAPGLQAPDATDATMGWVSIVPRFHLLAGPWPLRFAEDGLESAHPEDLR